MMHVLAPHDKSMLQEQHKKYLALIAVVHFMPHIDACCKRCACVLRFALGGLALGKSHLGGSPHSQSHVE
eukprot:scaffold39514_cov150-Skeletonema_dohrnii-CCMP3373.AAC.2